MPFAVRSRGSRPIVPPSPRALARRLVVLAAALAACTAPDAARTAARTDTAGGPPAAAAPSPLEQGRTYARLVQAQQFEALWPRLSPEFKRVFASAAELGSAAGQAVAQLGAERGVVAERVDSAEGERIYTRRAAFANAPRPMLLQFTMTPAGELSGFVLRPAPAELPAP